MASQVKLISKLSRLFDGVIRSRGLHYFQVQRVRILNGSSTAVEAVVRGSKSYEVTIEWDEGDLMFFCECAYYNSEGPCKHLWATVLAADQKGYLSSVEATRKSIQEDFSFEDFAQPVAPPRMQPWKTQLNRITFSSDSTQREWPAKRHVFYVIDLAQSIAVGQAVVTVFYRDLKMNGEFNRMTELKLERHQIVTLPLAEDREILSAIGGGSSFYGGLGAAYYGPIAASSTISHPLAAALIPVMVRSGRCFLRDRNSVEQLSVLRWDGDGDWQFELELNKGANKSWQVGGVLRRGERRIDAAEPALVTRGGFWFTKSSVSALAANTNFEFLERLRQNGTIEAPAEEVGELVAALLCTPDLPRVIVPEELELMEVCLKPQPCLKIRAAERRGEKGKLAADLSFAYEGQLVGALEKSAGVLDSTTRRFIRRDPVAEKAAVDLLAELGVKQLKGTFYRPETGWVLAAAKLPAVVRRLVQAGWHLEAEGKIFRKPGEFKMNVSSGVDWFELHGEVEYGETSAQLPALLEAMRRGEKMVRLDDGTYGILPEEWMQKIGVLAGMGTAVEGHVRFRRSQAGLLDALLASQPEAKFDAQFERMRDELRGFKGVGAVEQPKGFVGKLRDYQREGLGWMEFLRRFSFGGCLADDMGVGKTAQVLAMLEARRGKHGPTLVVVPRSLIFNWKEEAARFTPKMRVYDYTGLNRGLVDFSAFDLVLTTYGTLRRDALRLKDVEFDYVVLDEAQAVKNASTESAKAVRLLRSKHRLALSGTPVENHLGELWSLFEFLNPGMLGAASVFQMTSSAGKGIDEESRKLLAQALRPFILRRTKDQVVKELPAKTEQTIYCELEPEQRKLYNELREHYRGALLKRIETEGMGKAKIMVLEALLRLRQAACHPGLIDVKRSGEPSAKLDALLEQLREVLETGHKALVFSQFTSMLKILRERLDRAGVVYEYLDGKTRDRQACVERFQTDAGCKLFLISLKAGGLGLNLTEAEYVFLLDPWWNPAVEAQAVDRAHRIGQKKAVFAYRLIARDTVEEKVLELQKTKKDLAAAIVGEDNALIRNLKREDLELLLS